MVEFRYYLNRQGVRGAKGDKGEKGPKGDKGVPGVATDIKYFVSTLDELNEIESLLKTGVII